MSKMEFFSPSASAANALTRSAQKGALCARNMIQAWVEMPNRSIAVQMTAGWASRNTLQAPCS